MGGNALPNTYTRRYDRDEFTATYDSISNALMGIGVSRFDLIPSFRDKDTFGDMDIIVDSSNRQRIMTSFVGVHPWSSEIYDNGDVVSIAYLDLQVDFIFTPTDRYQTSLNYFAYNDLGNLIGRVAKAHGYKFGHNGFYYVMRDLNNTVKIDEVLLTIDTDEMLVFLGYNPAAFHNGFDTLENIFEYVASSNLFSPQFYDFERRTNKDSARDRKRKTYRAFLDWLSVQGFRHKTDPDKAEWLHNGFNVFSGFKEKYDSNLYNYERQQMSRQKFNARKIIDLTGLQGKTLGGFYNSFKKHMIDTHRMDWVDVTITLTEDELEVAVKEFYRMIQKRLE